MAGPFLQSLENLSSDRRLRPNGKVPGGPRGSKWQKEAELLEPAALASAQAGLRGTPSRGRLGAKEVSRELGRGAQASRVSESGPHTFLPGRGVPARGRRWAEGPPGPAPRLEPGSDR